MTVILNGRETELAEAMTVLALLEYRNIPPQAVVVERNGVIVPGDHFGDTVLSDGDHLEVLRFVGGG